MHASLTKVFRPTCLAILLLGLVVGCTPTRPHLDRYEPKASGWDELYRTVADGEGSSWLIDDDGDVEATVRLLED